jgi:hypothetical protein
MFTKKELTLTERLARVQQRIQADITDRDTLIDAVRQAEAETQTETALGQRYRTDGNATRGIPDSEIEVTQPRRQRAKLQTLADRRADLAIFDAGHDIAGFREEEKRLQARIEAEEEATAMADDAADCREMLQHLDAAAAIQRRLNERRHHWWKRGRDIGLRDGTGAPRGTFEPEFKNDPLSCLLGSIRLMVGRQHPTLIADEAIKAKIARTWKEGFAESVLRYPTR